MEESIYLPPGFRFHPTDEEIITHYLSPKVLNPSFSASAMGEVDLNKCEPWDLPSRAKMGEKEWYFFCQRDRKYPTGTRTNRATEAGYWKATGKDKEIFRGRGVLVGMKKTLVFYTGRAPKGLKSNWVMHEYYRLEGKLPLSKSATDEWTVCRVFHKGNGSPKKSPILHVTNNMNIPFGDLLDSPNLPPLMATSSSYNHVIDDVSFNFEGMPAPILPNPSYFNNNISYMVSLDDILPPNFSNNMNQLQFPINNSIVSDDTGLSTDPTTEISSMWKC